MEAKQPHSIERLVEDTMLRAWSLAFLLFAACTDDDLDPPSRTPLPIGTPAGVYDPVSPSHDA